MCISDLSLAYYMPRTLRSPWFAHPNNTWWRTGLHIWSSLLSTFLHTYVRLLLHHFSTHSLRLASWCFPRGFLTKIWCSFHVCSIPLHASLNKTRNTQDLLTQSRERTVIILGRRRSLFHANRTVHDELSPGYDILVCDMQLRRLCKRRRTCCEHYI